MWRLFDSVLWTFSAKAATGLSMIDDAMDEPTDGWQLHNNKSPDCSLVTSSEAERAACRDDETSSRRFPMPECKLNVGICPATAKHSSKV